MDWRPLAALDEWDSIIRNEYDKHELGGDSVIISKSFFLRSGEGYVFLLNIIQDNSTKSISVKERVALMVKINAVLPLDDLSNYYNEEQDKLRSLQTVIEKYFKQKFCYPDVLYSFLNQVICDDGVNREKN